MALKDLIAEKGALDEASIERIIGPYARYDVDAREVSFTPAFANLPIRAKILVFLTALQGWRFVADDEVPADARPAEIEAATGIAGGSLRPALRGLCDNHLIAERKSRYSVRGSSFASIESELKADEGGPSKPSARRQPPMSSRRRSNVTKMAVPNDTSGSSDSNTTVVGNGKRSRGAGSKTTNIAGTFERWIDEGYFDEPRTLSDVQNRFRKEAIMIPRTSLPGYFLKAVRGNRLVREEASIKGRTVWTYLTFKKATK
jgi:hypothetical protein